MDPETEVHRVRGMGETVGKARGARSPKLIGRYKRFKFFKIKIDHKTVSRLNITHFLGSQTTRRPNELAD